MHVPARASPSSRSGCSIKMAGGSGVRRKTWSMPQAPESIMPNETLILTMGRPQGVETITDLPGFQSAARGPSGHAGAGDRDGTDRRSDRLDARPLVRLRRGAGRSSSTPPTARRGLGARRICAASRWSTGSRGAAISWSRSAPTGRRCATASSAPILPGLPSGQEKVASLEALDTFAGSNKSITPPGTPAVMVTKLEELEERGGTVLSMMSNMPLVVRGAHGFGRVTLIALDVDQKPFSDWPDRSLFWVRAIDLQRPRADHDGAGNPVMGGGPQFYQYGRLRPVEPASRGARAVSGRQADPVRLGRVLHLPLHPA